MKEIITYFHTDCLLKNNGINHPERKERLESILSSIKSSNLIAVLNLDNLIADPIVIIKAIKEIGDKLNIKSYPKINISKSETLFPDNLKS